MSVHYREEPIELMEGDLLLLPLPEGTVPLEGGAGLIDWRLGGRLSGLILSGRWTGKAGERLMLLNQPKLPVPSTWLEGLGEVGASAAELTADLLRKALRSAKAAGARRVVVAADPLVGPGKPFARLVDLARDIEQRAGSELSGTDVTLSLTELNLA